MNPNSASSEKLPNIGSESTDDAGAKEETWQQIQQHFQTTQTSLSVRLICEGQVIQQLGDVKSGVKEAARLFKLHNSPQKAVELIASQENNFTRKCRQWEQAAKSAEARERAKATGGRSGSSGSAANRKKLEAEHIALRGRINNAQQCLRRLRTALNRGISFESRKKTLARNAEGHDEPTSDSPRESPIQPISTPAPPQNNTLERSYEPSLTDSKLFTCLQKLVGEGLNLEYASAPYLDPFSDQGIKSREAIWTERQPYCLIIQWEDSKDGTLSLKFWIVPKRPELIQELQLVELPSLFLHAEGRAEKLNLELVAYNTQNGPLTSEMNQLITRLESERFLMAEPNSPLYYLYGCSKTETEFSQAIESPLLLELL